MNNILLSPPIAFLIYVALVALLNWWGRRQAPVGKWTATRVSTYSSGEAAPTRAAVPGYRRFFVTALFFAVLHLGVLVLEQRPTFLRQCRLCAGPDPYPVCLNPGIVGSEA